VSGRVRPVPPVSPFPGWRAKRAQRHPAKPGADQRLPRRNKDNIANAKRNEETSAIIELGAVNRLHSRCRRITSSASGSTAFDDD
jgi:hypothetical protein